MKLFFVRHGKDDENFRGGWSNLGLMPEGAEQAKRLATLLKEKKEEYGIKKILSSDLVRAKETAEILAEALGVPVINDVELREADNGSLAGMPNAEALEKYPGVFWSMLKPDECYPNGESPNMFFARIKAWFEAFLKECKDIDGNVLVVTHGGVINVVYHLVRNMEWSNAKKPISVGNCSVHVMDTERMEICEALMLDELRYQEITESHLDELAQLYVDTFNAAPWNDEWTFETARKRLQQLLHSEDSFGLCVYQGGQLCGAVLGVLEQYFDGPMYNLHEYWVKNEMRGKGIGSKLFAETEKRLLERGVKNIILFTAKGDATEHFYHKQGMGTDPDMVFMSKRIGD